LRGTKQSAKVSALYCHCENLKSIKNTGKKLKMVVCFD
jgi:hypothetical protein